MVRTSKKEEVLEAAYHLIERRGINAITYETLSEETGMSKSGLLYHFPSRHQMLVSIHTFAALRWEKELETISGNRPASELSSSERHRALILSLGKNDPVAELLLSIHASDHPDFSAPWKEVETRWLPNPAANPDDPATFDHVLISLMALGLWVHDHVSTTPLSASNRERAIDAMLEMIEEHDA